MRSPSARYLRMRATSSPSPGAIAETVFAGGFQSCSTGVPPAGGRAIDPAITRFECGRLANSQSRFSFGQKAHNLPPDAASDKRALLRVQLLGNGMGVVQWSPSRRVR